MRVPEERRPQTHAASPRFALGEHIMVLLDFFVYRGFIVQILPDYAPYVNAYVVCVIDAPAYIANPNQMVIVEGATDSVAIVGRPNPMLDWGWDEHE